MILRCDCKGNKHGTKGADFQDATYGKGKRVFNPCPKQGGATVYRCTVCEKDHKK